MPAYLSQIAAAASANNGSRRGLSPSVRSRSPIAERDQRLAMTNAEWSLEGSIATDPAPTETPVQTDSQARTEPRLDPSAPFTPLANVPAPRTEFPQFAPQMPREESVAAHSVSDPDDSTAKVPAPFPKDRARDSHAPHDRTAERATARAVPQTGADDPATVSPEQPSGRTDSAGGFITEIQNATPSLEVKTAPRAPDSADATDAAREFRTADHHASRELPSQRHDAIFSAREEPAPVAAQSGVFIDRIEVEVVSPPSEKPAAKPAARPPARSAPVSQIGPLRGVPAHLAFSLRHR